MREPKAKNGIAKSARRAAIAKGLVEQKTTPQIAASLGVSRKTVWQEANDPETQRLIRQWMRPHHERLQRVIDRSISNVERALELDADTRLKRIAWLTDRIERMRQVIDSRAKDPVCSSAPGGETGLIVHQQKSIGGGDNARIIDEFKVDDGLLAELRNHERQLREELNDFGPNLKAVERARDLLELAEGRSKDGDSGGEHRKWSGTLEELLIVYHKLEEATA